MKKDIKILFVDDDEITRMVMVSQLSARYSAVFSAPNGREGLELFSNERPDVVVTDLSMPVMTGTEMIKEIRKVVPEQNIIVISGFAEELEDTLASVVYKPITAEVLFKEINKLAGLN